MRLLGQTVLKSYYAFGQHEEQLNLRSAFDCKLADNLMEYLESYYFLVQLFVERLFW